MTDNILESIDQPLLDHTVPAEGLHQPSDLSSDELAVVAGGPFVVND